MPDNTDQRIVLNNVGWYQEIAQEAAQAATNSAADRNRLMAIDPVDHVAVVAAAKEVHKRSITAVVFSALAVEAAVNHQGQNHASGRFFAKHLDSLRLISKLVVLPKVMGTKEIPSDGQLYERAKWLVAVRNRLVHSRARTRNVSDLRMAEPLGQMDFVLEDHARRAVETMDALLSVFVADAPQRPH